MQTNLDYKVENYYHLADKEVIYLDQIDAFIVVSVRNIDTIIDAIEYLESDADPDYTEYINETAEFSYLDMNVWVDIRVQNDLCRIEAVTVMDNDDNEFCYLSGLLKVKLSRHYALNSFERAAMFNQALEIENDRKDFYNLRAKMPTGYSVNPQDIRDLESICEDDIERLKMFLEYGSAGSSLILKKRIKSTEVVRSILPIIKNNVFNQVKSTSKKNLIAAFIHANFRTYERAELNIRSLTNIISRIF